MFLLPGNAVNRSAPLNRGLVSWWMTLPNRLGGGGNTFRDLMGRNHGTLTNGPTWSGNRRLGGFGSIAGTSAASSWVDCSRITQLDGATRVTIRGWIYRSSTGSIAGFGRSPNTSNRVGIIWYSDGNLYFCVDTGAGQAYRSVAQAGTGWHYVELDYDGSLAGTARIAAYVDGVSKTGSTSGTPPSSIPSHANSFGINTYADGTGGGGQVIGNGSYDDVSITVNSAFSSRYTASARGYQNELNWQRYPVVGAEQAAATFNPAWAINSNAYIHLGA